MQSKLYKVNEIFYSIQGEGFYSGTPMVFVRFSGCNLNCWWCDTNHAPYTEMTLVEIKTRVTQYPDVPVCFTGGEPLLQLDQAILHTFKKIHIETNGTIFKKFLCDSNSWITVSPKNEKSIKIPFGVANEIKVVYPSKISDKTLKSWNHKHLYIQPRFPDGTEAAIKFVKDNPEWKLSVQIQRILKVK